MKTLVLMIITSIFLTSVVSAVEIERQYSFTAGPVASSGFKVRTNIIDTKGRVHHIFCFGLGDYSLEIRESESSLRKIDIDELGTCREIFSALDEASLENPVDIIVSSKNDIRVVVRP